MVLGTVQRTVREDHMVWYGRPRRCWQTKAGAVEGEGCGRRANGLKLVLAVTWPLKEQVLFTGLLRLDPGTAEHYIDWRIQCVEFGKSPRLRQQLDDLIAARKRWLAVTGGRSKVGNGNGHGAASPA